MRKIPPATWQALCRPVPPETRPAIVTAAPTNAMDLHSQFASMDKAFARHGGMLRGEDMVHRMRGLTEQPMSLLARWIVARQVIAIEWQLTMLVPMFQFHAHSMKPSPACREIVSELSEVMDDWAIGLWFATCNLLLDGLLPVDMLSQDPGQAMRAARAATFVAGG